MKVVPIQMALLAMGLFLCLGAQAADLKADFDQGVDASAALELTREAAGETFLEGVSFGPAYSRWDQDCATFSFGVDAPLRSERVMLESRIYEQRCINLPPQAGGRHCREEWVRTERRRVRVDLIGRGEMLPWERDVFEVCLNGHWLHTRVIDASHKYDLQEPGWNGDTVTAVAGSKIRSNPDPAGVHVTGFGVEGGNYALKLADRWAGHYSGESTVITVQLKRHRSGWFDGTLLTKELSFPAAESYSVRFADFADEFRGKLKEGAEYYVRWRFKRVGRVSKDTWQGYWKTGRKAFSKDASALGALSVEAQGLKLCLFRRIEKDQCVYKCTDGGFLREPVREPDPFDRDGTTIPCPQILIPLDKD